MYIHVKFSFPLHFNRIKKKKSPKKIVVWVGKGVHPIRSERGGYLLAITNLISKGSDCNCKTV